MTDLETFLEVRRLVAKLSPLARVTAVDALADEFAGAPEGTPGKWELRARWTGLESTQPAPAADLTLKPKASPYEVKVKRKADPEWLTLTEASKLAGRHLSTTYLAGKKAKLLRKRGGKLSIPRAEVVSRWPK